MIFRRDQIQGRVEPVAGAIRELAGEVSEDPSLEETISVDDGFGKGQSIFSRIHEQISKLPG